MNIDQLITPVKAIAQEHFSMHLGGIHGIKHWERVHENGVYLAKHSGANLLVVRLFAYLHDCCRETDGSDREHGLRAAQFAKKLKDEGELKLEQADFDLLYYACEYHERGRVSDNPTIGTCWDSDRLDLGRVAIRPNPQLLSTARAKSKTVIDWAYQRSRGKQAKLKA